MSRIRVTNWAACPQARRGPGFSSQPHAWAASVDEAGVGDQPAVLVVAPTLNGASCCDHGRLSYLLEKCELTFLPPVSFPRRQLCLVGLRETFLAEAERRELQPARPHEAVRAAR